MGSSVFSLFFFLGGGLELIVVRLWCVMQFGETTFLIEIVEGGSREREKPNFAIRVLQTIFLSFVD